MYFARGSQILHCPEVFMDRRHKKIIIKLQKIEKNKKVVLEKPRRRLFRILPEIWRAARLTGSVFVQFRDASMKTVVGVSSEIITETGSENENIAQFEEK